MFVCKQFIVFFVSFSKQKICQSGCLWHHYIEASLLLQSIELYAVFIRLTPAYIFLNIRKKCEKITTFFKNSEKIWKKTKPYLKIRKECEKNVFIEQEFSPRTTIFNHCLLYTCEKFCEVSQSYKRYDETRYTLHAMIEALKFAKF